MDSPDWQTILDHVDEYGYGTLTFKLTTQNSGYRPGDELEVVRVYNDGDDEGILVVEVG